VSDTDNPRRRATDPKDPRLVEYGLEYRSINGTVVQVVVWTAGGQDAANAIMKPLFDKVVGDLP
jgi:hypothetical protein